ncbi:MAG: hypothetical protein GXO50_11005 [Chlorobi bacterium]|nr:hypothetical protein [Chlorobiota bacterium]
MNKAATKTVEAVTKLLEEGKKLALAGDEEVLSKLPEGNWIGGTTPYFITEKDGGEFNKEKIYAEEIPEFAEDIKIKTYDEYNFDEISSNFYDNGFTLFIIPAFSGIHEYFALNNWKIKNLYKNPFVGWVSGFDLNTENASAKVYNGLTGEALTDKAVAIHVKLPDNKKAGVNIVNIFNQDKNADKIEFLNTGFEAEECLINDKKVNFADYLSIKNIDTKLPLVADYSGIKINVSIKAVDTENKKVHFYAPVFENRIYRTAEPIKDYTKEFKIKVPKLYNEPAFSCNCILNYLYGELENNKLSIGGPVTFGEIAYGLLNQTLVYMTVNDNEI